MYDASYKRICCELAGMCELYYEVRPRSTDCYTLSEATFGKSRTLVTKFNSIDTVLSSFFKYSPTHDSH